MIHTLTAGRLAINFTPSAEDRVIVWGNVAVHTVSTARARAEYSELLAAGWVKPSEQDEEDARRFEDEEDGRYAVGVDRRW